MTITQRIFQEKRRLILPLVIAVIANIVAYAVVVFPLGRQVAAAEQEMQDQRDVLRRARQNFELARATVTGKQQADVSLRQFYTDVLPPTSSAAQRVTYLRLAQLARDAHLRYVRETTDIEQPRGRTLTRLRIQLELSGTYADIRSFVHALETSPEFVVIDNLELTQEPNSENVLTVKVELSTYYLAATQ